MEAPAILAAVVDDEMQVCKAIGRLLRSSGFEVQCFGSASEFIESLGGRWPNCLILDVRMPGMTGFDLQARLDAVDIRLPIVFITAFDDSEVSQQQRQAGGVGFLRKPFTEEELLQAIGLALDSGKCRS